MNVYYELRMLACRGPGNHPPEPHGRKTSTTQQNRQAFAFVFSMCPGGTMQRTRLGPLWSLHQVRGAVQAMKFK